MRPQRRTGVFLPLRPLEKSRKRRQLQANLRTILSEQAQWQPLNTTSNNKRRQIINNIKNIGKSMERAKGKRNKKKWIFFFFFLVFLFWQNIHTVNVYMRSVLHEYVVCNGSLFLGVSSSWQYQIWKIWRTLYLLESYIFLCANGWNWELVFWVM